MKHPPTIIAETGLPPSPHQVEPKTVLIKTSKLCF